MKGKKLKVKTVPLKSYTIKEIRELYGISARTWREWIRDYRKEINIGKSLVLTIKQVQFIFEKFGVPGEIEVEMD